MAQKIQTLFIDDIDGSEAEGMVRFGLDSTDYEIDLNVSHSEALHRALSAYIEHARKTSSAQRSTRRSGSRGSGGGGVDTTAARAWAREQGIEIKDRGRVPADVVTKYKEATGQ